MGGREGRDPRRENRPDRRLSGVVCVSCLVDGCFCGVDMSTPGRTRDRHRAGLTTVPGQISMALDTRRGLRAPALTAKTPRFGLQITAGTRAGCPATRPRTVIDIRLMADAASVHDALSR